MSDIQGGSNGNYYHQSGGQSEIGRANANGDWIAAYNLTINQGGSSSGSYSGGGSIPYIYKSEKKILYFIFIFIPKFIFYYLLFKNFGKTFLMVFLVGLAYMGYSDFGKNKMSEYQWTLKPEHIVFSNIDKDGFDAKLLKKYRSLDANELSKVHEKFDELPIFSQNTFRGVIRERLLQNPDFFKPLENSPNNQKVRFALSTCLYAKSFSNNNAEIQNKELPYYGEIVLQRGYFQFYKGCANLFPATQYYETIKHFPQNPTIKSELDRLNSKPLFYLTRNYKNIAEWSAVLGGLLFLIVLMISMTKDAKVREEKRLAKTKLESEKLEKDEKPKTVSEFKAEKNIFTE